MAQDLRCRVCDKPYATKSNLVKHERFSTSCGGKSKTKKKVNNEVEVVKVRVA